jgi:hypothetical protein
MIVAINYSQLSNTDALVTRERKLLDDSFDPTDPHLADVDQRADQSRDLLNQSTIAFAKAGPNRLYPIVATKAGNTGGFFVIPFTENTDVEILDKSMHSTGVNVFDDHARLYDGKIMPSLRPINPADARPEFAQALASLPDAAVRIVINPDVFEELLAVISTPRTLGLGDLTDLEWVDVKCCAMSVSTTPNLTGSILLICVDHDSAESLRSMLAAKFAHLNANPPSESLSAQVAAQISNLNPQVSGNTVQFTLDQNIMEPLVADWFKNIDYRPH